MAYLPGISGTNNITAAQALGSVSAISGFVAVSIAMMATQKDSIDYYTSIIQKKIELIKELQQLRQKLDDDTQYNPDLDTPDPDPTGKPQQKPEDQVGTGNAQFGAPTQDKVEYVNDKDPSVDSAHIALDAIKVGDDFSGTQVGYQDGKKYIGIYQDGKLVAAVEVHDGGFFGANKNSYTIMVFGDNGTNSKYTLDQGEYQAGIRVRLHFDIGGTDYTFTAANDKFALAGGNTDHTFWASNTNATPVAQNNLDTEGLWTRNVDISRDLSVPAPKQDANSNKPQTGNEKDPAGDPSQTPGEKPQVPDDLSDIIADIFDGHDTLSGSQIKQAIQDQIEILQSENQVNLIKFQAVIRNFETTVNAASQTIATDKQISLQIGGRI